MVTLAKIAKESGFSVPVVSRALSPKRHKTTRMAEKTRTHIQDVAKRLEYQPNRNAEFLKRGQSPVIGCFLPERADSMLAKLMRGISREAEMQGFPISFYFDSTLKNYKRFIEKSAKAKNCGIITYPYFKVDSETEELVANYANSGGGVVLIEGESQKWRWHGTVSVSVDNYHGGKVAAKQLLSRGASNFLTTTFDLIPERIQGFVDEVLKNGGGIEILDSEEKNVHLKVLDFVVDKIECDSRNPVGVFLPRDADAFEFINRLWDAGCVPGEDVYVIGYDDQHMSEYARPALTTVAQPFEEVGKLAVSKLIEVIYDKKPKSELVKPKLIVRNSA